MRPIRTDEGDNFDLKIILRFSDPNDCQNLHQTRIHRSIDIESQSTEMMEGRNNTMKESQRRDNFRCPNRGKIDLRGSPGKDNATTNRSLREPDPAALVVRATRATGQLFQNGDEEIMRMIETASARNNTARDAFMAPKPLHPIGHERKQAMLKIREYVGDNVGDSAGQTSADQARESPAGTRTRELGLSQTSNNRLPASSEQGPNDFFHPLNASRLEDWLILDIERVLALRPPSRPAPLPPHRPRRRASLPSSLTAPAMNNFPQFLDNPGNAPRQAPTPTSGQAQTNGVGAAGVGLTNPLPSAGHQADMNHLWNLVQQLSEALAENRSQTANIIEGVQEIQARAAAEGHSPTLSQVNGELNGEIASLTTRL